jgi:cytoskeleton protein RodZ
LTPFHAPPIFGFLTALSLFTHKLNASEKVCGRFHSTVATTDIKKGGFGEHLRREREMRGISLDEIASATRIGTRFLEAMENEQWSQLPGGVFNRGFVRAVAHHLGLDEETLVAEYTLATGDMPASTGSAVRNPVEENNTGRWVTMVLVVILIGAIAGGGWYLWHRHKLRKSAPAAPASASVGAEVARNDARNIMLVIALPELRENLRVN